MKLFDWFRAKKQEREARKQEEAEQLYASEAEVELTEFDAEENTEVQRLDADPAEIDPPATRFTEEYREFLKQQEAARSEGPNKRELK